MASSPPGSPKPPASPAAPTSPTAHPSPTAPETSAPPASTKPPELPKREFYGYAVGFIGPITLLSLINVLLVNYYMLIIGLDPVLAGVGLSIGLVTYSVFAIGFGNVSDNAQGSMACKYGKRRPFILYAALPMAVTFILLWVPPVRPETFWAQDWGCAAWLWIFSFLFHLAFAVFSPPYWALMPEITHSEEERLRLSITQNLINLIGTVVSILIPIIFFAGVDTSGENLSDALFYAKPPNYAGEAIIAQMFGLSFLFAGLTVASLLVTFKLVREPRLPDGTAAIVPFKTFLKNIVTPLTQDKDHALYQAANFLINVAMRILMTYVLIFIGDVLGLQGGEWFIFTLVVAGAAVGSFVFWDKLKDKVGLKQSFVICMVGSSAIMALGGIFVVEMERVLKLVLGTVVSSLLVIALVGILIFPNPIISALVDKRQASLKAKARAARAARAENSAGTDAPGKVSPEHAQLAGKYQGINLFILNFSSALANVIYAWGYKALKTLDVQFTVLLLPIAAVFTFLSIFFLVRVHLKPPAIPNEPIPESA